MTDVTVVDYGMGNLFSVRMALEHCGARVNVTSNPSEIEHADRIVLPGVGAFTTGMNELCRNGLDVAIKEARCKGTPLLGICLGMQMLFDYSKEFEHTNGLGMVNGGVVAIPNISPSGVKCKIPHIGWAQLESSESVSTWQNTILSNVDSSDAVYFVHSFMAKPDNDSALIAMVDYGGTIITAVVQEDNVVGCQFHPEKSGPVGLAVLKQFLKL
ncbi:MAG: imidazole glycerol phosphate synthase subunit HisH [Proteobacteria bacterium]|nr:imidazole glycerol phosphate synthase subunit HisH [Pseudomonadota bacterium]NOG59066.1 imidazole glycerol phosphate synthase subunit HisH [Pseudomonadota bacterium]